MTATTPVLAQPLEGQVFVGSPECSPCSSADAQSGRLLRLFMQLEGPGPVLKFPGTVSVEPGDGPVDRDVQGTDPTASERRAGPDEGWSRRAAGDAAGAAGRRRLRPI